MACKHESLWRSCFWLVVCTLGAGLISGLTCLPSSPLLLPGVPADDSVSVQMVAAATTEIRKTNAAAVIAWAGGHRGDNEPLQAPSETNVWDFLAVAVEGSGATAWLMHYDGSWSIEQLTSLPMGVEYTSMTAVTMDVVEAWSKVLAAGYQPPFKSWELFKPLNPNVLNPIIVFNMPDGSFVIVDSVTGEVSQERGLLDCFQPCRSEFVTCVERCSEDSDSTCRAGCDDEVDTCNSGCGG